MQYAIEARLHPCPASLRSAAHIADAATPTNAAALAHVIHDLTFNATVPLAEDR